MTSKSKNKSQDFYVTLPPVFDPVNKPQHYNTGKIEVIDFIHDQKLEFNTGNALKYICRAKHKGTEIQDLEKAVYYLNHQIKLLKECA